MVAVGEGESVDLWAIDGRSKIRRLSGHQGLVESVAYSPDGQTLASAADDDTVRIWEAGTAKLLREIELPRDLFFHMGYAPDGILTVARRDGIHRYEPRADKVWCRVVEEIEAPWAYAFSPNDRQLAVASKRKTSKGEEEPQALRLWDPATGKKILEFERSQAALVMAIAFSTDGTIVLTGGRDGAVRLWEVSSGKECGRFVGHEGWILSVAFAADGRTALSAGSDTSVLVWDLTVRRSQARLEAAVPVASLWQDLASTDATKAYRAGWMMVRAPGTAVPYLHRQLRPVVAVDQATVLPLIRDLDSDRFGVRQQAAEELARLGELAAPALQALLARRPSLDVERRVERLLGDLGGPVKAPDRLQCLRAISVLERINTPQARLVLGNLARGAPEARATQTARAALERLARKGQNCCP
jgi:hypothetical protein